MSLHRDQLATFLRSSGYEPLFYQPLTGDVSPRRYVRLDLGSAESAIVALYPTELGDACDRFVRSTALLQAARVRVPRILAVDCSRGLMLLEDLGPETLFERRSSEVEERLPFFERAVEAACRIAALAPAEVAALNPPLDAALLDKELQQAFDLYLAPHGLLGAGAASERRSSRAFGRLCAALGAAAPVPCHRDFMARNLVPRGDGVAVLDHQDLRLGPPGYDLASLLNDSFFPSAPVEARLLARARLSPGDLRHYHRAALQRTLKAIGTFAAFARRGFERHLALIPPTLKRALLHLPLTPETAELSAELEPLWARH